MDYQPPPSPIQSGPTPGKKTSMGLDENIAAALSYLCGWITGLVFFLVEKDSNFVRFHALQSLILFGGLNVLAIGLIIFGALPIPGTYIVSLVARSGIGLICLVAWIVLLIKAYQGERFHFPVVGDIAEKNLK